MKFIIGKKLDMTQVWQGDKVVAVTRVQAGPCIIAQVKTDEKDGYSAVQVGYGKRQKKNIKKPQLGHLKKLDNFRYLREFRFTPKNAKERQDEIELKRGDKIDVGSFAVGDKIQVTSTSKGKGFQGVVKRHGFHGQDKTHGTKDQLRMPGSIGATGPAHVFKGQKMPGRMGGDRVTVKGLEVVEVDQENDVLSVKGAVPGARNGLVLISGEGDVTPITPIDAKESPKNETAEDDAKESKELGGEVESKVNEDDKKVESKIVETQNVVSQDVVSEKENKEVKKDEDIEKVVVEAKEKVEESKKRRER
ncbi:50S ribosomal protein L3 [Candidatus Parcubacteria bacterium]|nr:50S ribosomal protein L3 [Candidatus Parcubacteria bacterium]